MGRPSKCTKEICEQAEKLCLLGATDAEMADFFGVAVSTISYWKVKDKGFSEAVKNGKTVADATVAQRLYQRATGYTHDEDQIFQYKGDPVVVKTTKHYPPETTAGIFWLHNRQRGRWKQKQSVEVSGPDEGPIETKELNMMELARQIAFVLNSAARSKEKK